MARDVSMRNMFSVIDAVDFILHHTDRLTSTERNNLADPLKVSRTLFRRILGQLFPDFEIRKNTHDYSIRCNDPDVYKTLNIYTIMNGRGISFDRLDRSVYSRLVEASSSVREIISPLANNRGLSYKFRDEHRFFIYVSYFPSTEIGTGALGNQSLHARILNLDGMYNRLRDLRPTPIATKFSDFISRFGTWSLGYLPRQMGNGSVTEEFLDYALAHNGTSLEIVSREWLIARMPEEERRREEERRAAEEARRQVLQERRRAETERIMEEQRQQAAIAAAAPSTTTHDDTIRREHGTVMAEPIEVPNVIRTAEPATASQTAQQRFRDALARVSATQTATVPVIEVQQDVQEAAATAPTRQTILDAALARLREERGDNQHERFLRLRFDLDTEIVDADSEPSDNFFADEPPAIHNPEVDDAEYIRLLAMFPRIAEQVFQPCLQDVVDDLDNERHGVYFTIQGTDLRYLVYGEGQLLMDTLDHDQAMTLYTQKYGQPEAIRYLEEMSYV